MEKLVPSPRIRLHVAQGRELLVEPGFKVDTQAGVTTLPESGSDQQPRRNGTSDPPVSVSERMTRCQASYGFRAERRRMPGRLRRLQFGAQIA